MITSRQINTILVNLENFRRERGLTTFYQREGLLANLLRKLSEYTNSQDEIERVNVLCDIVIYALNASGLVFPLKKDFFRFDIEGIDLDPKNIIEQVLIMDYNRGNFEEPKVRDSLSYLILCIDKMGFHPYDCLIETIKETSSKKGKWDDTQKKLVKLPGVYNESEIVSLFPHDEIFISYENDSTFAVNNVTQKRRIYINKWYRANYEAFRK